MTQIIVLPHVELCPDGAVFDAVAGESICWNLLQQDIEIEHACEMSCACTTCHVVVREGFNALEPSEETEDDLLDNRERRDALIAVDEDRQLLARQSTVAVTQQLDGHRVDAGLPHVLT